MDYDSPWKEAMDWYFEWFMHFFFPRQHALIDWTRDSDSLDSELRKIYDINLRTFGDNFLFEPIPFEIFRQYYVPSVQKTKQNRVHFVCDPQGKEVGYFSTFIEADYLVLKTIAIAPEGRGHRLSNALLYVAVSSGRDRGALYPLPALMRDGIQSESYSRKQKVVWKNRYALFSQELL